MAFAEYGSFDALGLAELVRSGQASPTELLDEALARTAQVNPKINAVIHLMEGRARGGHRGRPARGAVSRRAVPDQGLDDGLCR
jgi:Asp-tRNA(Asn)/Glu-tRNA(Gln) amidotransferase A subunit family amidase